MDNHTNMKTQSEILTNKQTYRQIYKYQYLLCNLF